MKGVWLINFSQKLIISAIPLSFSDKTPLFFTSKLLCKYFSSRCEASNLSPSSAFAIQAISAELYLPPSLKVANDGIKIAAMATTSKTINGIVWLTDIFFIFYHLFIQTYQKKCNCKILFYIFYILI